MNLRESYAEYGLRLTRRSSWSARSVERKIVVLTMWQDEIRTQDGLTTYAPSRPPSEWRHKPGNKERIENIRWALTHCNGVVRVVIAIARNPGAKVRRVLRAYPQRSLVMKITEFDEDCGYFQAIQIADARPMRPPPPADVRPST
jgi:hypothetical protein